MTDNRLSRRLSLPSPTRSLSARLLVLTVLFVMLAEVLIFAPSVGRYRLTYLEEKLATGHLGILALEASPADMIDPGIEREILSHIGVYSVALQKPDRPGKLMLMIEEPVGSVEASYDLREAGFFTLIRDAVGCLVPEKNRVIRVVGWSPKVPDTLVELVMDEAPLQEELRAFGWRILGLSLVISAITAGLVYLTLIRVMVVPMRRLTENMIAFRDDPEDGARIVKPSGRSDEIGVAEQQLHDMQGALRALAPSEDAFGGARHRRDQDQPRSPQHAVYGTALVGSPRPLQRFRSAPGGADAVQRDRPARSSSAVERSTSPARGRPRSTSAGST